MKEKKEYEFSKVVTVSIWFHGSCDEEKRKGIVEEYTRELEDRQKDVVWEGTRAEIKIEEPYSIAKLYLKKLELEHRSESLRMEDV